MKNGKYVSLGSYQNIRMGYGTVDYKNLKTIYIRLNSWLLPESDQDIDKVLSVARKSIKDFVHDLNNDNFKKESIVDLNIKTRGIKIDKKSFMNLEVTLFTNNQMDIKNCQTKTLIKNITESIVDNTLTNKKLFNFYIRKK